VRARRTFRDRRPVPGCVVAVQGQHLQQSSFSSVVWIVVYFLQLYLGVCPRLLYLFIVFVEIWLFYTDCGLVSLARLRPVRGRRTRIKYVIGLTGMTEAIRHSWYQSKKISEMADRRDLGGGGDDPEESTQRMIVRIWESLTDIRARMDQQAPVRPVAVPPGDGEAVPVALVPPRVEVPFVAHVPPPVLLAEEPVLQVETFLRLQPPTYSGGPNPDTAEHWVHEIERVFATMRLYVHPRAALSAHPLSLLPQLRALVFLKVLTGIEEWLVDRGTRGVAELREETSRSGAIRVGARGGLDVNQEIVGDSNAF
ncbi:hypothetical protein Taro_038471, partial [Colocasia esculenta]|nr:hypothetical protein [Colocasia esculenta]